MIPVTIRRMTGTHLAELRSHGKWIGMISLVDAPIPERERAELMRGKAVTADIVWKRVDDET